MKQTVALIAFGLAISFAAQAYAAADAGMGPAAISVAAPDNGVGDGSHKVREVLRGVVAAVDERNDRITVQLAPDARADLKVRDGLLFNAVRYGDRVEITVEDVDGAKTIVDLMKE
jgi:Cu/Ag efflux protein CusF